MAEFEQKRELRIAYAAARSQKFDCSRAKVHDAEVLFSSFLINNYYREEAIPEYGKDRFIEGVMAGLAFAARYSMSDINRKRIHGDAGKVAALILEYAKKPADIEKVKLGLMLYEEPTDEIIKSLKEEFDKK